MAKGKKKLKKSGKKSSWSFLKSKIIKWIFILGFTAALIVSSGIYIISQDLPNIGRILEENKAPIVTIKDMNGTVLAKYGDIHGASLTYKQIPKHLIEAVLSTEDRRFFSHMGIDPIGLLRAAYFNYRAGRVVQGGSTLTQQLAKISLLTSERTMYRKIQEALLSIEIEKKFSKQQIISMYLNRVYLGRGNYGVDAASKFYFGKNVQDLNLYEAAILAGMLKSPNKLSPANDKEASMKRAKQVLYNMESAGYISVSDIQNISPPRIIERGEARGALHNPYFADYIMEILPDKVGPIERNLTVYTTLDLKLQNNLESALKKALSENGKSRDISQAAAVTIDSLGAIKAWVGGVSYRHSQFDRVYKAKRQPGSAFKLFVYLAALENGVKLTDHFVDHPISIGKWRPRNFSRDYQGDMTVKEAFAKSINTIAVQLSEKVGREKVVDIARSLGITEDMPVLPSVALGSAEVTLLQMSNAYASVANKGYKIEPVAILKVYDSGNRLIYSRSPSHGVKVISNDAVNSIWTMMRESVLYGTSKAANIDGVEVYGKTGTSQDYRDAWFFGFADGLTTGVWVGNDDNRSMKNLTGGAVPAVIWKQYILHSISPTKSQDGKKGNIWSLFGSGKKDTIDSIIGKSKK